MLNIDLCFYLLEKYSDELEICSTGNIGMAEYNDGVIFLHHDFFEMPHSSHTVKLKNFIFKVSASSQDWVLLHEAGHYLAQKNNKITSDLDDFLRKYLEEIYYKTSWSWLKKIYRFLPEEILADIYSFKIAKDFRRGNE